MIPKTIVVPLDGSPLAERAVKVATPLAQRLGATVTLVATPWDNNPRTPRSYLDCVVALAEDAEFEVVVVDDSAADAIKQTVRDRPRSMVCMTTHGRGRLRWAVAGSVAEEVIGDSADPLLLVGPRGEPQWSQPAVRIVVCIDGSASGRPAVELACEWAQALDLEVALVTASHPLDVEAAEYPGTIFRPLQEIVREAGLPVHTHQLFRSSFVAGSLVDFAEAPPATLMVMATHHRRGLARMALGSVTMGVLNTASCPVLVVPASSWAVVTDARRHS